MKRFYNLSEDKNTIIDLSVITHISLEAKFPIGGGGYGGYYYISYGVLTSGTIEIKLRNGHEWSSETYNRLVEEIKNPLVKAWKEYQTENPTDKSKL